MTTPTDTTEAAEGPVPATTAAPAAIEGRSLGRIAWLRFRRDKAAMAGGVVVILLVLLAVLAKPIESIFGLSPDALHQDLLDADLGGLPMGSFGGMSLSHPLGVDPLQGRDLLARIIEGSWVSLLVAFGATVLSNTLGTVLGVMAGYYGGWVDTVISRIMDTFLAFPLLLFAISISASLQGGAFGLHGLPLHLCVLIFVIGFFNWPYMGRIVRGQTLSLRERGVRLRGPQPGRPRPVHPVQGAAAEPGRPDPGLLDPADPDQHPLRGRAELPRRRYPAPAVQLGRDAERRDQVLPGRPGVHGGPGPGDLHHRARLQPAR